jgi:ArsR family transcriptional regulator, arsenate/arsenite/antimonite-responsive transcriptional repressor
MTALDERAALFRALAHPARLLILNLCWDRPRTGEELTGLLQLSAATVSHHLSVLDAAHLSTSEQAGHHRHIRTDRAAFSPTLEALLRPGHPLPAGASPTDPYAARVLRSFVRDGRLTAIPAQRRKRDVVLAYLATEFEPGRAYPENEVNALLGVYHPDHATLRRELVDAGLLRRERGLYERVVGETDAGAGPGTEAGAVTP